MYLCVAYLNRKIYRIILNKLVVFASGSGSNFQSIIDAVQSGKLDAEITGLVTDRAEIKAIERAEQANIPVYISDPVDLSNQTMYELNLISKLRDWDAELLVLAGYLKKIPGSVLEAFPERVLNIHPSLLPKFGGKGFYGLKVHQAVLDSGDKETGCSVHVVTEEFDKGPVLDSVKVPVNESDNAKKLARKVLEQEHILYPKVISQYLNELQKNK